MVRINLLPREVLEKRRFEQRVKYLLSGGLLVLVVLGGVYGLLSFIVGQRNAELQDLQQLEATLRAQAESFAIFEQKESELEARVDIAQTALADRVAWGRLANELSLVLPADVWLTSLVAGEETGVTISSRAVDAPGDTPDVGHKTVARTLVRLVDLEQLSDVWLSSSAKTEYEEQPVIEFSISASVNPPGHDEDVPDDAGAGSGEVSAE